ncbi:MAG: histidine--tRNA ligase [Candidatus Falkowbacteria bacterium]|nr:histidine--tRNA ligase [Candidatus Falkowbacteria bacterium]
MSNYTISNQEPKGTRDWFPEEFLIRKYIFDTWRQVCLKYGFEEYLTPLVESAEIYRAKSGEDVGGKELVTFTDLGGRELSIRPEMTPSVTRMVSKIYTAAPKPLKYFSIANFMRNEKPQRGRNREFWQLNCDTFGSSSLNADSEILQLALDLMLGFEPPKNSFTLNLSNRKLIDEILSLALKEIKPEIKIEVVRTLDKWNKLSAIDFKERLESFGLNKESIEILEQFINSKNLNELAEKLPALKNTLGYLEIDQVIKDLTDLGYGDYVAFNPAVIRGFDYYDGLVFEVFDNSPDNNRAMFGGGRYNGLAEIFGSVSFPAVGFAIGDETTRLFLESWGLIEKMKNSQPARYYLPLLDAKLSAELRLLTKNLRRAGQNIIMGLEEQKIGKALEYANKNKIAQVIIFGADEKAKGIYKIKNMMSGQEEEKKLN